MVVGKMELMRKILSSPLTRRRAQAVANSSSSSEFNSTADDSVFGTTDLARTMNTFQEDGIISEDVPTTLRSRYFGIELSELVSRDGTDVPRLLLKLSQFICARGLCIVASSGKVTDFFS